MQCLNNRIPSFPQFVKTKFTCILHFVTKVNTHTNPSLLVTVSIFDSVTTSILHFHFSPRLYKDTCKANSVI